MHDREKQLAEDKRKLDDQVAAQLKAERARIIAEESKKAKLASAAELENNARELADRQEMFKAHGAKLAEAQKAQTELIKKQRELDDVKIENLLRTNSLSMRSSPYPRVNTARMWWTGSG